MKKHSKMLAVMIAMVAATLGAMASPVYYTILHALEEDTMEVFTAGGQGSLSISQDGGESFTAISRFNFDSYGRGVARVYPLNKIPTDSPVKLVASFNEGVSR